MLFKFEASAYTFNVRVRGLHQYLILVLGAKMLHWSYKVILHDHFNVQAGTLHFYVVRAKLTWLEKPTSTRSKSRFCINVIDRRDS